MSQFNFNDYVNAVNAAQNGTNKQFAKVGYFKLGNDGDQALVRINCSTPEDLDFASVHTISTGGRWIKVSCMNPLGTSNHCELCEASAAGNSAISKASKKVYIQMLVSYQDKTTGTWAEPVPVVWERPAMFSRELVNKLRDYGDLKEVLLKITRNGAAGDMKTTYSLDYVVPTIFKPEMIPADFSAFNNFNIAKHSYWEKTADEIHTFVTTGTFPDATSDAPFDTTPAIPTTTYTTPVAQPIATPAPAAQPATATANRFSF